VNSIQLIAGLGNPGAQYTGTRHNVGAWCLDMLTQVANCRLKAESQFHGLHAIVTLWGQECHLLCPTTYMNESGLSVRAVAKYYKIPSESILILHDDIDLPPGVVRLKFDGGTGGHNGLEDIIDHLHTKKFHRLRFGVGHPGHGNDVVRYVLDVPSVSERTLIQEAIQHAQESFPEILSGNFSKAMQKLHQKS